MTCPGCQAANRDDTEACFTCGRALHALTQGAVLAGRYQIEALLGRGGMGTVYKARDRVLEEDMAIKVLRPEVARDPLLARRFRSEIKLARRVTHRNVCRIHEYGEDGALRYISMEYIDGVDLKTILQSMSLAPADAFGVSLQVVLGLQAVHEIGIIHRDLKSSNVMIDSKGVVRLLDFGIAKEAGSETTGVTLAGKLFGTPEYMSPEHARGMEVGLRSDIYSLGCLIYEIFARRVPFHGENAAATILKHFQEAPAFGTLIPEPLVPVLARALAKDPADRFQGIEQLIDALEQARLTFERSGRLAVGEPESDSTRPVQGDVEAAAVGASTYGSVWRRTDTGRMRPIPQPFPAAPPAGQLGLLLWSKSLPTPWRWALPVVFLAIATMAARQVLSPALRYQYPSLAAAFSPVPPTPDPGSPAALPVSGTPDAASVGGVPKASPPASAPDRSDPPAPARSATPAPARSPTPAPVRSPGRSPELLPAGRAANTPPLADASTSPPPRSPTPDVLGERTPSSGSPEPPRAEAPPWTIVAAPSMPPSGAPSPAPVLAQTIPSPDAGNAPDRTSAPAARAANEGGILMLVLAPESPVTVDGESIGVVSSREVPLGPGPHVVRVLHPDYKPLQRKVTIRQGATTTLTLDLAEKGIRKTR